MAIVRLLADRQIYLLHEALPDGVSVEYYDYQNGLPANHNTFDAIISRTVSPINSQTLPVKGNLKFAATASAGIDHVDTEWLNDLGIEFAAAPGCNARSVAEYVTTSLLLWMEHKAESLKEVRVGIIGAGNTGSSVAQILEALGIPYMMYDPPRAAKDTGFKSTELLDLLSCPVLTFHCPLSKNGRHPTYHLLNSEVLENHKFELIINSSRGGVVDDLSLHDAHLNGRVSDYVLDVWENEPVFCDRVAGDAFIKTPHIAGYSQQSKWNATLQVVNQLCALFDLKFTEHSFPGEEPDLSVEFRNKSADVKLSQILRKIHPVNDYDNQIERFIGLSSEKKGEAFQQLRNNFPMRHEYGMYSLPEAYHNRYPQLAALGIGME
jgi:erythronate-4-phosphate dehydrogenase